MSKLSINDILVGLLVTAAIIVAAMKLINLQLRNRSQVENSISMPSDRVEFGDRFQRSIRTNALQIQNSRGSQTLPPTVRPQESDIASAKIKAEKLLIALSQSTDPSEMRDIRRYIAALKPAEVPFRLTMERYARATTDEEKLHLQSIISMIDPVGIENEVGAAALISDNAMCISLIYSLRQPTRIVAKNILFTLTAEERFGTDENGVQMPECSKALQRCLMDVLVAEDLDWIKSSYPLDKLNALQKNVLANLLRKVDAKDTNRK